MDVTPDRTDVFMDMTRVADRVGAVGGRLLIDAVRPTSGDPMRVVIADDVMLVREGITRLLTDAGIDVVAQSSDAVSLLREVTAEAA